MQASAGAPPHDQRSFSRFSEPPPEGFLSCYRTVLGVCTACRWGLRLADHHEAFLLRAHPEFKSMCVIRRVIGVTQDVPEETREIILPL